MAGPHRVVNPAGLAPPAGFAHAVVAAPGRTVDLGGQAAQAPDGRITGATLVEQFEVAGLFDPQALVELVGIAVVPDQDTREQP